MQKHYFANKGPSSQSCGFSSSHVCGSWTMKKTDCQWVDAFVLWFWRRLLRVPWTARRSNQSILKEINAKYSLEGLMLKLKLQCFGPLLWISDQLVRKDPDAGKGRRRRGQQMMRTQWTWIWVGSGMWWGTGEPGVLPSMGSQRVAHDWVTEQQNEKVYIIICSLARI